MTTIRLTTHIDAPIEYVFDRSRDIDFHKNTASKTQERTIAGVQSGYISMGETVTWKGKHFGLWLTHESLITAFEAPKYFVDEMITGNFKNFKHEHYFTQTGNTTIMKDALSYKVPYGFIGVIFDNLFLKSYLTRFLKTRNAAIKVSFH
ncbi:cell division protein [Dokdonia sp. Asnod3-C12]|uniref:SRPBCC family protein n=1 Tax=Dokdonia sp. Asnod3-C12 TaxID=3160575 RepID=UPI00386CCDA4